MYGINGYGLTLAHMEHKRALLTEEVRAKLWMLPDYSVFEWFDAEVDLEGAVTLSGKVLHQTIRAQAEASSSRRGCKGRKCRG